MPILYVIDDPENSELIDRENLTVDLVVSLNGHSWKKTITVVSNKGTLSSEVKYLGFKEHYLSIPYSIGSNPITTQLPRVWENMKRDKSFYRLKIYEIMTTADTELVRKAISLESQTENLLTIASDDEKLAGLNATLIFTIEQTTVTRSDKLFVDIFFQPSDAMQSSN